jgi:hypothetical protein
MDAVAAAEAAIVAISCTLAWCYAKLINPLAALPPLRLLAGGGGAVPQPAAAASDMGTL